MPWDKAAMWDAVVRLAEVSHSHSSNTQRMMAEKFQTMRQLGMGEPEFPQTVDVSPLIEADTGKLAAYKV